MSHLSGLIELRQFLSGSGIVLQRFFVLFCFLSDFPEEERELITPTHPSTLVQVFCPSGKLCPTTHPSIGLLLPSLLTLIQSHLQRSFFFLSQINTFTEYGSSQGYLSKKYFSSLPEGLIVFKEIGIFRLFPKGKFNKKLTRAEKKLLDKNETDLNQPVEFLVDCFRKVGRPTLCQNLIFCYSLITSISKNTEISVQIV